MFINPHSFSPTSFLENETTLRILAHQQVGKFVDNPLDTDGINLDIPFLFRSGELYIALPKSDDLPFQKTDWQTFQISEYVSTIHATVLCHGPIELVTVLQDILEIQALFEEKFADSIELLSNHNYILLFCKQIIGYMK